MLRKPNSHLSPSPLSKDEPVSGLDCSGEFKAAPDIRLNGPAAGCGYVLRYPPKVKLPGTSDSPSSQAGAGSSKGTKNKGLDRKSRLIRDLERNSYPRSFLDFAGFLGSGWVFRTASASISRSSDLVFGGSRVGFCHWVIGCI
jgi:hypothetical protein